MLKIIDNEGKTKFVLRDEDDEPRSVSIDELIVKECKKKEERQENKDAN